MPAAARQHTKDGAKAFAKYFTEQMGQAFQTGDSTRLRQLYARSCSPCEDNADQVDRLRTKGQHAVGTNMVVYLVEHMKESRPSEHVIDVLVQDGPYRIVSNSQGRTIESYPKSKINLRHHLVWRESRWVVVDSFLVQ